MLSDGVYGCSQVPPDTYGTFTVNLNDDDAISGRDMALFGSPFSEDVHQGGDRWT